MDVIWITDSVPSAQPRILVLEYVEWLRQRRPGRFRRHIDRGIPARFRAAVGRSAVNHRSEPLVLSSLCVIRF